MTAPDIVTIIHDFLKSDPDLADVQDWNKANGFISLKPTGVSVGISNEKYESNSRASDYCTAKMSIFCWLKNKDQSIGENDIRNKAHTIRKILSGDKERSLNGEIIGCFVSNIDYLTTDAGQSLLLHIAEITVEVEYEEARIN